MGMSVHSGSDQPEFQCFSALTGRNGTAFRYDQNWIRIKFRQNRNGNVNTFRLRSTGISMISGFARSEWDCIPVWSELNKDKIPVKSEWECQYIPVQINQNFNDFWLWPTRMGLHSGIDRNVSRFQTLCSINQFSRRWDFSSIFPTFW